MSLPVIFDSIENVLMEIHINEMLKTNEESRKYGLWLSAQDAKEIIETRNHVLQNYGRIELDIRVTREVMNKFCASTFINQDDYSSTINELQEIFYYMKNETEDGIGDDEIIDILKDFFENCCGGSIELLKGMIETFSGIFRRKNQALDFSLQEGGK